MGRTTQTSATDQRVLAEVRSGTGLDITSPPSRRGDGLLWGDGFEIETLIHMRVAEEGLRVAEVPSFEHSRIYG
jgi:hypothetical protein